MLAHAMETLIFLSAISAVTLARITTRLAINLLFGLLEPMLAFMILPTRVTLISWPAK